MDPRPYRQMTTDDINREIKAAEKRIAEAVWWLNELEKELKARHNETLLQKVTKWRPLQGPDLCSALFEKSDQEKK